MPDLYETLGVDRSASQSEIRRAYRNRAKKVHPDAGGDPEEFRSICMALAVLGDPERRRKYDETGTAEAEPDTREAVALNTIAGTLDILVNQSPNPFGVDLIATLKGQFRQAEQQGRNQKTQTTARAERWSRLAEKFTRKSDGDNMLASIARGKAVEAQRIVEACDVELAKLELCLKILDEYEFNVEARAPLQQMFGNAGLGIGAMPQAGRMW